MTQAVPDIDFAPDWDQPIRYIQRTHDWYDVLGYGNPYRYAHYLEVPFTPLAKPLERDLDAVERDLNCAYISRHTAESVYGVVIATQSQPAAGTPLYSLDRAASQKRREQLAGKPAHG